MSNRILASPSPLKVSPTLSVEILTHAQCRCSCTLFVDGVPSMPYLPASYNLLLYIIYTIYGAYPSMMAPPLPPLLFSFQWHSINQLIIRDIFLIYSWIFVVSSWIVVLMLTCPQPPSVCLVYTFRMLDLVWNPLCIVRSFFVFIPLAFVSSFGQVISTTVECLLTARAYALMDQALFQSEVEYQMNNLNHQAYCI